MKYLNFPFVDNLFFCFKLNFSESKSLRAEWWWNRWRWNKKTFSIFFFFIRKMFNVYHGLSFSRIDSSSLLVFFHYIFRFSLKANELIDCDWWWMRKPAEVAISTEFFMNWTGVAADVNFLIYTFICQWTLIRFQFYADISLHIIL